MLCPHSALFLLVWMEHVSYIVHTGLFEDLLGSSLTNKCIPLLASLPARDGHGIPKCCPCPSVVFLMLPGPSVRFRVFFLGGEYVCPSYGPLKFLKLAKLGQKSVRPFVK